MQNLDPGLLRADLTISVEVSLEVAARKTMVEKDALDRVTISRESLVRFPARAAERGWAWRMSGGGIKFQRWRGG